ncbi:hypothetical protein SH661x_002695 [Planctomicrobium sp. SH661]|uniref:hypothetical protein n=1 Tax=Planctomicrobium sp. SH661 TaxID=3448124 RepID=UPI003F5C3B0F
MNWIFVHVEVVSLAVLLLAGCSAGDGLQRVEVRGKVTLDGEMLERGTIAFYPTGPGTVVGTEIVNGTFHIPRAQGPVAGEYRVEIDSVGPTGRKTKDSHGEIVDEYDSIIPPKFNRQSESKAVVESSNANDQHFELTGKNSGVKK